MAEYRLCQASPLFPHLILLRRTYVKSFEKLIDLPALKILKFSGRSFYSEAWIRSRPEVELLKPSHLYLENVYNIQSDLLEMLTFIPQLKVLHCCRGTPPGSSFFLELETLCPDLQAIHLVEMGPPSLARASLLSTLRSIAAVRRGPGGPLYGLSCQYDRTSTEQYCQSH